MVVFGKSVVPDWVAGVDANSLRVDAFAGITGAAVVLPQAVAFAAIAGLPPEYGLYTSMVTPVVAALLGSSLLMVSGPTTAISAVVFGALVGDFTPGSPEFIQAALLLALLVGLMQVAFAVARVGRLAGFVSHSVMIGFTASAALLIAVSQLGPALGLESVLAHGIVDRVKALITGVSGFNGAALVVSGLTVFTVVAFKHYLPRWPGFLIAIAVGTLSVSFICEPLLGDASQQLTFVGALPAAYPSFALPSMSLSNMTALVESAFAISLIGLLEAIAIGRSLAHRSGSDFSANQEVFAQGMSNAVGSMFHCYPASGSFTRSSVNMESGAKTPLAVLFSVGFLVLMVAILSPVIQQVPIAAVAGLILYVAYRLLNFEEISRLIRTSSSEGVIAGLTFFGGVLVSLEFAILIGTFSSLAVFLSKSANPALVVGAPDPSSARRKVRHAESFQLDQCPAIVILRLDGPLFFGSIDSVDAGLRTQFKTHPAQVHLILILQGVGEIDMSGVELLTMESDRRKARGGSLRIVAPYPPLVRRLNKLGLAAHVGQESILDNKGAAIAAAVNGVEDSMCRACDLRVFLECDSKPKCPKQALAQTDDVF